MAENKTAAALKDLDADMPEWQCPSFDELMVHACENMPVEAATWFVESLAPYRDALTQGEGTKRITMKAFNDILKGFFMLLPVPNFHQFGFFTMLQPASFQESKDAAAKACGPWSPMVWRAATLVCGIREMKRKALTNTLPDEVLAGHRQTKQPLVEMWTMRRARGSADGKEHMVEKSATAAGGRSCPDDLVLAVTCGTAVYVVRVPADGTADDVAADLTHIVQAEEEEAQQPGQGREAANDAQQQQQLGFCQLTYVLRPDLMTALGSDDTWHAIWDEVQNADFAVALFPRADSVALCPEDPVHGAMAFLRPGNEGGTVGDKNTLCVLGDGAATYIWDHVLMDGAPGIFFASHVYQHADKLASSLSSSSSPSTSTTTPTTTAGDLRRIAPPAGTRFDDWSDEVRSAMQAGMELSLERTRPETTFGTRHIVSDAFGRDAARAKGLSVDALFQATLQLALADLAIPELHEVTEVVSTRHFRYGRTTNMTGNSALMDAFVAAARDALYADGGDGDDGDVKERQEGGDNSDNGGGNSDAAGEERKQLLLLTKAALLLRGAVHVHKERIKAHKRCPPVFANMLMGFGEQAQREQDARATSSTEPFDLSQRCLDYFMQIASSERPRASRCLMMDSITISNGSDMPGVAVFGVTPSAPLVLGYIMRADGVEIDAISRCADLKTPRGVPLLDALPRAFHRAARAVADLLKLL
ncbi:hypothetical protein PTSG_03270 [Salpingoeca rosetta]|uniref:Choline/carnitine acyltransferase domain-containing protein n=1 Tax=Salpingoeca rosetta (strain ATCC 50818 / BSB-021) TaxID=946362 RepID=F2U4P9_SALR5|nr:uncharacterized protein PTSG_03270 [Salpingoeca rosetta]EGD82615.1 hypothetical protein PTSG_03270 [Salpingoeca rosetta]|eukprot:XP_004995851.1 hypothetical protein PTSG_03270 [Salpingoeca rosetta]